MDYEYGLRIAGFWFLMLKAETVDCLLVFDVFIEERLRMLNNWTTSMRHTPQTLSIAQAHVGPLATRVNFIR